MCVFGTKNMQISRFYQYCQKSAKKQPIFAKKPHASGPFNPPYNRPQKTSIFVNIGSIWQKKGQKSAHFCNEFPIGTMICQNPPL